MGGEREGEGEGEGERKFYLSGHMLMIFILHACVESEHINRGVAPIMKLCLKKN